MDVVRLQTYAEIVWKNRITSRRQWLPRRQQSVLLPNRPNEHNDAKIWTNSESIMCRSEDVAYAIADIFDAIGGKCDVDYYDPEEDERNGEIDECTGYWYVCV